jgi:hypothetical protein
MKLNCGHTRFLRRNEEGSAVIVVIVLLAIMMIYIGANLKTLHFLRTELKLIETRQVVRVQGPGAGSSSTRPTLTNSVPETVAPELKPEEGRPK